ncbi:MAG TPA: response regulator [Rubrivivax sp.]|nr:response regulator [Rubrivivax sp.]
MQLLYVDDDRINLMLFENACAGVPGVQVATAADGAEALELARTLAPQLLVIDLHLPDIDGPALLQTLRREAGLHDAPAFLCSAEDGPELRRLAAGAGFAGCWAKPVDSLSLRRELAALGLAQAG